MCHLVCVLWLEDFEMKGKQLTSRETVEMPCWGKGRDTQWVKSQQYWKKCSLSNWKLVSEAFAMKDKTWGMLEKARWCLSSCMLHFNYKACSEKGPGWGLLQEAAHPDPAAWSVRAEGRTQPGFFIWDLGEKMPHARTQKWENWKSAKL